MVVFLFPFLFKDFSYIFGAPVLHARQLRIFDWILWKLRQKGERGEPERERDRQRQRQRQTDRQTDRDIDRGTERESERERMFTRINRISRI